MKATCGISIEENLLRKAKRKAERDRRSFSSYIEGLILKDLGTATRSKENTKTPKLQKRAA